MIISAFVAGALLAQGETITKLDYNVFIGNNRSGTAVMTIKDDGRNRSVGVTMDVKVGALAVTVRQSSTYGADGAALTSLLYSASGKDTNSVNVTFDARGANVNASENDKTSRSFIPLAATAPRTNPSLFWFTRTTPKIGEKISYYSFDANTKAWRLMTSEYAEFKSYSLGGQSFPAHHVLITRGGETTHNWLDAKGQPLAIIQPNGDKLERAE